MQINSATGLITWNPGISQVGVHNVVVKLTDQRGAFDTQSFTVTVISPTNKAPVVNAGPDVADDWIILADLNIHPAPSPTSDSSGHSGPDALPVVVQLQSFPRKERGTA